MFTKAQLMRNKYVIFFIIILLSSIYNKLMAGEETVIPLNKVPAELLVQAQKLLPSANFKTANTEKEDNGSLVYEIQGKLEDNRKVEVDLLKNGDVEEFEIELTQDLIPEAVLQALKAKIPDFVPGYIEASYSASKKVVGYEFVGEQNGKKLDIDVSVDGRIIKIAHR